MIAIFRPVRNEAGSGRTHPSCQPRSMICSSICRIETAGWLMESEQAASHSAGQMRPVISGRLLAECSKSSALRHWRRWTISFQSGTSAFTGQP